MKGHSPYEASAGVPSRASERKPAGILFVNNSMNVGGLELKLLEMMPRFDRSLFRPVILCLRDAGVLAKEFRAMDIPVYTNILHSKYDIRALPAAVSIMKKERISLIYTFPDPNTIVISSLARWITGVPRIVVSVHSTSHSHRERLTNPFTRLFLRRVDRVIVCSETHKRILVAKEKFLPELITVVFNGTDLERFSPHDEPSQFYAELGLAPNHPVVGIVASLIPDKSHGVFLRAASMVLGSRPDTQFLVVGDGPERSKLEGLAWQLGIEKQVIFTGTRRDVERMFSLMTVSTLSSKYEAFPNVVVEAMACGKPVVATNVGALEDIVVPGETGLLVAPENPKAFAEAVLKVISDPELADSMGRKGRERAEKLYSIEDMTAGRQRVFEELLPDVI